MPRPSIDLTIHKSAIISQFQNGVPAEGISQFLYNQYHIVVEQKTIRRRLLEWGISKRKRVADTPELRIRISVLFYQCCLSDPHILTVLTREGYAISGRSLARIRKEMGLRRRINPGATEEADCAVRELVQKELDKGFIEGLGRGNLFSYFRNQMHIISR